MHAHGERPNPRGWVGIHIIHMYVHVCTCRIDSDLKKQQQQQKKTLYNYDIIRMHVPYTYYNYQAKLTYIYWEIETACMCVCVYLTNVHLHETCTIDHVCIYHCTNSYIHTYIHIHQFKYMYTDMCMTLLSIGEINSHGTYVIIAQRLSYNFLNMHQML